VKIILRQSIHRLDMLMPSNFRAAAMRSLFVVTWMATVAPGQTKTPPPWTIHDRLAKPVTIAWENRPLRDGLLRLSEAHKVAIWLDRRVDPGLPQDVNLNQVSLDIALRGIAAQNHLGISVVGDVVYLGPSETASKLRTLSMLRADEAKRLPASARAKALNRQSWKWAELTTPQQLLIELLAAGSVTAKNAETIPHDLWPANDLPPLSWTDRMTLLLAQFGKTFAWRESGAKLEIVAIPSEVSVERSYPLGAKAAEARQKLLELFPNVQIELQGNTLVLRGSGEAHDAAALLASGRPAHKTDVRPGEQRYTLRLQEIPLAKALESLEPKLAVQFDWDPAVMQSAEIDMNQRVSLDVQEVSLDQLVEKLLSGAKIVFHRQGSKFTLQPKK
jgi:hypothetical protein